HSPQFYIGSVVEEEFRESKEPTIIIDWIDIVCCGIARCAIHAFNQDTSGIAPGCGSGNGNLPSSGIQYDTGSGKGISFWVAQGIVPNGLNTQSRIVDEHIGHRVVLPTGLEIKSKEEVEILVSHIAGETSSNI